VSWRYGEWTVDTRLPIGVVARATVGQTVHAGDVIASGVTMSSATRVAGARRLGVDAADVERVMRVRVGMEMAARTVIARTGRRFARAVTAPHEGRLLQVTADGDIYVAPVIGRWSVRATLDGSVTRSTDAAVTVAGSAWCLEGTAAFGPDAIGELTRGVDSAGAELAPSKLDVRLGGRIVIGGARVSAESLTRAHACGVAGLVAGAVPAAGLRLVYGDAAGASGLASRDDRPTMLCLLGFGSAPLPLQMFDVLQSLAGQRAAIHTATARLFVFAAADAADERDSPPLALMSDYGGVRALAQQTESAGVVDFASEVRAPAVRAGDDLFPVANVRTR
jgi:hypothetical protein